MAEPRHIHIRIRDLRRERSLTQEELAAALGVSRQSINAMEAGRCLPSLPVALQIASFFSVPLASIFAFELEEKMRASQKPVLQPYQPNARKEDTMSNLMPWSPLREMRQALDELMDETVTWGTQPQISVPAVNISQTENEVQVQMRLPGYTTGDLSIEAGEDFLTVSGQTKQEQEEKNKQFVRREFVQNSFTRTVSLPTLVESEKAEAEMKHGVLTVSIPKQIEEKPKTAKITIKSTE